MLREKEDTGAVLAGAAVQVLIPDESDLRVEERMKLLQLQDKRDHISEDSRSEWQ
jgi:hypothetical protein